MFRIVALLFLVSANNSSAVYIYGSSDNTNAPTGLCGNDKQGDFYPVVNGQILKVSGTPIGRTNFITAKHNGGNIGDTFVFRGETYQTVGFEDNSSTLLRSWKVDKLFPNNSWADIYTNRNELGKQFYVHGRGPRRGGIRISRIFPTSPIVINSLTCDDTQNTLCVSGSDEGSKFQVQWSTNLLEWNTFSNVHCMPADCQIDIQVTKTESLQAYYRLLVIPLIVTNGFGNVPSSGETSFGINTVEDFVSFYADSDMLMSYFDAAGGYYESSCGPGDSGGGLYILEGGVWKLAGIVESSQNGAYLCGNGDVVWGPMCDKTGLADSYYSNGEWLPDFTYTSYGGPHRATTFYTRISSEAEWLKRFTN